MNQLIRKSWSLMGKKSFKSAKVFSALSWSWSSKSLQSSKDAIESHDPNEPCKPGAHCITLEKINAEEEKLYKEIKVSYSPFLLETLTYICESCMLGKWNGLFYQFDSHGNLLQQVTTKLSSSSYGEGELISLIQTLYIKQPLLYGSEEEWAEYKIKETNMFTIDKYQQIGFFPKERAFSLRYQTAGMLENVLRQGVLGENDTGEESPKNLKLPSRKPSVVCENCLYSQVKEMRTRAFHIMDPKGVLEMLLVFVEGIDGSPVPPSLASSQDTPRRITSFLGRWEGHSITNRSGVYDATISEADSVSLLEFDDKGQLIQDITSTSSGGDVTTNVHWTGTASGNLITFDGGFQMTLLPGGMYMACPCNLANSIAESKSFHLEFCWLESPNKRQRLVRTYDVEGLAVSSTYIYETKI